jgi:cysteine desulfurase
VIRIYADCNATTCPDPEVCALVALVMQQGFGNPSSIHGAGQEARRLVERARTQVAGLINAEPDEIVFTSGGTEADNLAMLGAAGAAPAGRRALVASAIEHHAVLEPCEQWQRLGGAVALVGVDGEGRLDARALEVATGTHVALVSVMLANNDTGVMQPVESVAKVAAACGALSHTDAVQAAGKMPIDVKKLGVSLLSLSSHKLHGPKGAGALFVKRSVQIAPLVHGGRQERGLRPGTENVPALVGFGKACESTAAAPTASDCPTPRTSLSSGSMGKRSPSTSTCWAWRYPPAPPAASRITSHRTCCWPWANPRPRRARRCASRSVAKPRKWKSRKPSSWSARR